MLEMGHEGRNLTTQGSTLANRQASSSNGHMLRMKRQIGCCPELVKPGFEWHYPTNGCDRHTHL